MKRNSQAFVNQLLVFLLVTVCCGGTVSVGLVWMRHQNSVLANTNRELKAQLREVERHIMEATTRVESAQTPAALRLLNEKFNLGLALPKEGQFVHVQGDPVHRLMARANEEIFREGQLPALPPITLAR